MCECERTLTQLANNEEGPVSRNLVQTRLELTQRDVGGVRYPGPSVFALLPTVQEEGHIRGLNLAGSNAWL